MIPGTISAQDARLPVVATFSILGDLVQQVGGDRVALTVLIGPGSDAHVYTPAPGDAKRVAGARLVVVNGLGFEGWLDRLIKASNTKAPVVVATRGIKPLRASSHGHSHGHSHGNDDSDPHAWQSIANVRVYVANIRDGLIAADPAGKETYARNATAYLAQLDALEKDVRAAIAAIPKERRVVVTNHDAFAYFGAAYGLRFIAPQGVSTNAAPSAQAVARIIRRIKKEQIPAVFIENITDKRLAERIASESGAKLGGTLYSDQLSAPGGRAGTYIDMVRHNIRELTAALGK
jgi:zinc/manganese transport system substrate-binding protein